MRLRVGSQTRPDYFDTSSVGQTTWPNSSGLKAWQEPRDSRNMGLNTGDIEGNPPRKADEVLGMRRGIILQESVEAGARKPWICDSGCVLGIMHIAVPGKAIHWGDRTCEPLDHRRGGENHASRDGVLPADGGLQEGAAQ